MSRRAVVTVDAYGQHRSGPPGAWWPHLQPRSGAGGFSPEMPAARASVWNASFVGTIALSLFLTQFLTGGPWLDVALFFGGPIAAAVPLVLIVGRVSRRRFDRLGVARQQPGGQATETAQSSATVRPVHLAATTGESA